LLSKDLIEKHNEKVPKNFDDLYALPGVGKKTASVVLNEGLDFLLLQLIRMYSGSVIEQVWPTVKILTKFNKIYIK